MSQIDTVWALTQEFVQNSMMVTINPGKIRSVATLVADSVNWRGEALLPDGVSLKGTPPPEHLRKMFLYELIANSVNYCFWYGRHNIRPNGSCSTKMYKLLDESFLHLQGVKKTRALDSEQELELIIDGFIGKLSRARFPLMEARVKHLNEILDRSDDLLQVIDDTVGQQEYDANIWLDFLITFFPGYGADLFLKRAFLFIMQMYRRCGLFADDMSRILVPADYQIPKMLRWLGCIEYGSFLSKIVDGGYLIGSGSNLECEIRAATIVACKQIADLANCTCEEVDTYLFSGRHQCTDPFHLTITTDY